MEYAERRKKELADELIELGVPSETATEAAQWIFKYNDDGEAAAQAIAAAVRCAVEATAAKKEEAKPEPPPVEIPRRVVWVMPGFSNHGRVGTVVETYRVGIPDNVPGVTVDVLWDDDPIKECGFLLIPGDSGCIQELQLTKTEQARLLLEKLSREAWEVTSPPKSPNGVTTVWVICNDGDIQDRWSAYARRNWDTVEFPSDVSAESARDTIARAGLAWWEVGE